MADAVQSLIESFGFAHQTLEQKDATVVKLCSLGGAALSALIEAIAMPAFTTKPNLDAELDNREGIIQLYAARTLGLIGKSAARAAPALADLFAKSRTSLIRREAAVALARIVPVQDSATNADVLYLMASALHGTRENWQVDVREAAALALGSLGPLAKSAVPQLLPCLMDRSERIRDAAFRALAQIGPAAASALLDTLRDRARIRLEFAEKGMLLIGNFVANHADSTYSASSSWQARQRMEECLLLEKIYECSVQILAQRTPSSAEFRAILHEIVLRDSNPKLQALATDVLAKSSAR